MHYFALTLSKSALQGQGQHSRKFAALVVSRAMSRTSSSTSKPKNLRLSSSTSKQQKPIHSSAKSEQSTPTMSMEHPERLASASPKDVPAPTRAQLKVLFTASAVPMIGFGFMDNVVMVNAGQFIDSTIGVTMGLATMTAAAAGQVVSDVSGVIFGGSLERFLHRYGLIQSSTLTPAQRALPLCRNIALLGAVVGVAFGCGLGASCLLFMDLEARERAERAIQLQTVLNDMMMEAGSDAAGSLHCESCVIYLAHVPAEKHFSTDYTKEGKTTISVLPQVTDGDQKLTLAARAAKEGKSIMEDNGTALCTPIVSEDEEVVAVLEFHSKKDATHGFTQEDEKAAKVMARHIGIFMHRLSD